MSKIISGNALRERLLARLADTPVPSSDAWVQALAAPGNRELMFLIALQKPQSISELSALAGRAQPNVSRSLTALVNAGLVEVISEGRASVPVLTALGRDKAKELGLSQREARSEVIPSSSVDKRDLPFLSVSFSGGMSGNDLIAGDLNAKILPWGRDEPTIAKMSGDLNSIALLILDHWWRMLYRRDAPYKLGEFNLAIGNSHQPIVLSVKSIGSRIEQIVRPLGELPTEWKINAVSLETFSRDLLDNVVRPVAAFMSSHKCYDRPVQSRLARLEDTMSHKKELMFAQTAGALGSSPYNLNDEWAEKIRNLIVLMPNEDSRLDFASAVLADDVDAAEMWVKKEVAVQGERNAMLGLRALAKELRPVEAGLRPWRRGTAMAQALRERLKLGTDVSVPDAKGLAAMFGAEGFGASPDAAPGALRAFQSKLNDDPTILVEEEGSVHTKFTLARAVGDFLVFRNDTSCVADLYTDRQAVGRAFAAEFVAPAAGVLKMIEDEDQSVERVARHYEAPVDVIYHQYRNNYWRYTTA